MSDSHHHDYETPRILHDAPLQHADAHHFHFDEFAVTLCCLIADKTTRAIESFTLNEDKRDKMRDRCFLT